MPSPDRILVPPFAEPHAHLDRAFCSSVTGENRSGTLNEASRLFKAALSAMTTDSLVPGATRALALLDEAGVGHVRTHTAIGGPVGFRAWEAVEQAAAAFPRVEVRQVAMPVSSNLHHPEVQGWLRDAADRGAVAVGGAPWRSEDPAKATRAAGELAAELGIGLDLHVDETDDPSVDTLPDLVAVVTETGLSQRTVAVHCCSLAARPEHVARAEVEALAAAGVGVVVCPVSNLSLQGRLTGVRGVAPLYLLREASVVVGIGIDNICDVVVSVGTGDPLRAAWLLALVAHLTRGEDLTWLGEAVVSGNRRLCGLSGDLDPADVLEIDAASLAEAVALVPGRRRLQR